MEFIFFLIVGICVGTFGTLIGLGGGLILVPLFMYTMYNPDGSATFSTVQQIVGTSLFAVACNAVSGAYAYMKQRRIMFRAAIPFALSTIPGAFCGSFVSKYFTGASFSVAFGCLLAVLGCFMYWKSNSKRATARPEDFDPATADFNLWLGVVLTFGVGFISTIFGIGGGSDDGLHSWIPCSDRHSLFDIYFDGELSCRYRKSCRPWTYYLAARCLYRLRVCDRRSDRSAHR